MRTPKYRRKSTTPADEKLVITIKGPWEKNRSAITFLKVVRVGEDRRKKHEPLHHPELVDLNELYAAGKLTAGRAKEEAEKLRKKLYDAYQAERRAHLSVYNVDVAERYIRDVISIKTNLVPDSLESEVFHVWRVMRLLGSENLGKAPVGVLQAKLNALKKPGAFKHSYRVLRALLKFIGRHSDAEKLQTKQFADKKPPYLTREQVYQLCGAIPAEVLVDYPLCPELIRITFNLGTRIGETLALERKSVMKRKGVVIVVVDKQFVKATNAVDEASRIREPKNKRVREVVPLNKDEFLKDFAAWLTACPTPADRDKYRHKIAKVIKEMCNKLFKIHDEETNESESFFFNEESLPDADDVREYKGVHMLRASHAVYIIETSGNDVFAANQIGDSVEVLRKHYSGKHNTEHSMSDMAKTFEDRLVKSKKTG